MYRFWDHFAMSHAIALQLVSHDLPGLGTMAGYQTVKESFSCGPISLDLQIYVNNFTILIYSPPQIMLFAIDLNEYYIDVEGVAVPLMLSLQSMCV